MWLSTILVLTATFVTVECILQTQVGCENYPMPIQCSSGITVLSANYGRQNKTICPGTFQPASVQLQLTTCNSVSAPLKVVTTACNSKPQCSVIVSNTNMGGDPCVNTYKYLTVVYECPVSAAASATGVNQALPSNNVPAVPVAASVQTAPPQQAVVPAAANASAIKPVPPTTNTQNQQPLPVAGSVQTAPQQAIAPGVAAPKPAVKVATTAKPVSKVEANKRAPTIPPKPPVKVVATAKPVAAANVKPTEAKSNNGNHYGQAKTVAPPQKVVAAVKPTAKAPDPKAKVAATKVKKP